MKITGIETYSNEWICLVRVLAGEAEGFGMTAPFSADISAQVLHRLAAQWVLGRDVEDFQEIADVIMRENYKHRGSFVARAASGVDTALWDLQGKLQNKPVAELAGGVKQKRIRLYGSSMQRNPQPHEKEVERFLELQKKYGFEAFKLHVGIPVGNDRDIYPGCTEDFIKTVRAGIGKESRLFVDVNGNYTVGRAIEMAHFLKENGVDMYEEPCPYWELENVAKVHEECEKLGLPIAAGEQDYTDGAWERMSEGGIIDIAQPDILYIGGFTRALRVAKACAKKGIPSTSHTSNRSPIIVFGLHFMAAVDLPYDFLECGIEDDP